MKDQDIIKAVAELDGWTNLDRYIGTDRVSNGILKGTPPGQSGFIEEVPSYLTSRDAIVPVIEKHIKGGNRIMTTKFDNALYEQKEIKRLHCRVGHLTYLFATPSQLCKALVSCNCKVD
jgi:hypothetical protein